MLRAAVVGLGRWGQRLVSSVEGEGERIRFVAGCVRTPAKVEAFAARHGLALGRDYAAVLADKAIDAVVLATPHTQHHDQVLAAAAAGKHVFCEKPFTLSKASAEAAIAACAEAGVTLAVGHNRRFLPAHGELCRLVRSGALGTVLHVEGAITGSGGFTYAPDGWRAQPEESPSGGMTAMGIHLVDAMIACVGPVAAVAAQSIRRVLEIPMDDSTSMLFRFRDGMTGTLMTSPATRPSWRMQVYGSKGSAEMRGTDALVVAEVNGTPTQTDWPATDTERAELLAFADAVAGRAPFPVPAADVVNGVAVLEAIDRSAKAGCWVDVP